MKSSPTTLSLYHHLPCQAKPTPCPLRHQLTFHQPYSSQTTATLSSSSSIHQTKPQTISPSTCQPIHQKETQPTTAKPGSQSARLTDTRTQHPRLLFVSSSNFLHLASQVPPRPHLTSTPEIKRKKIEERRYKRKEEKSRDRASGIKTNFPASF